jgi:hypothetical protein
VQWLFIALIYPTVRANATTATALSLARQNHCNSTPADPIRRRPFCRSGYEESGKKTLEKIIGAPVEPIGDNVACPHR